MTGCAVGLLGLDGMRALTWSSGDSSLFAVENLTNLVRIDFGEDTLKATAEVGERAALDAEIAQTVVFSGATSHRRVAPLIEEVEAKRRAALRGMPATDFPIGVFIDAHGSIGALVENGVSLDLGVLADGKRHSTRLIAPEVPAASLALLDHGGRRPVLTDVGVLVDPLSETPLPAVAPFSRAITSARDGTLLGRFSRDRIDLAERAQGKAELERKIALRRAADPRYYIRSAAADETGTLAYILKDVGAKRKIGLIVGGAEINHDCGQNGRLAYSASVETLVLGSEERPLFGILATQPDSAGLAVVFSGGPMTLIDDLSVMPTARHYLASGWDVLAVVYSGNLGSGTAVSGREPQHRLDAIEADAERTVAYLQAHHTGRRIIIHGESLGGIPAAVTSARIDLPHDLFLIAPLLKLRNPEEWSAKISEGVIPKVNSRHQRHFEKATLGVSTDAERRLFNSRLSSIYEARRPGTPTFVAFGKSDPLSKPDDLPRSWQSHTDQAIINSGHFLMTVKDDAWTAFFAWQQRMFGN